MSVNGEHYSVASRDSATRLTLDRSVAISEKVAFSLDLGIRAEALPDGLPAPENQRIVFYSDNPEVSSISVPSVPELGFTAARNSDANGLADIRFSLRSGEVVDVNLHGAATLGDVMSLVSAQAEAQVGSGKLVPQIVDEHGEVVAAGADGVRLRFVDLTTAQGEADFEISSIGGSLAGLPGLGIGVVGQHASDQQDADGNSIGQYIDLSLIHI